MALLTNFNCLVSYIRGMALPRCIKNFGNWKYYLLVPKGELITAANLANWQTYLQGKLTEDDADERWYLVGKFHTVRTAYQEADVVTLGDKSTRETQKSAPGWETEFDNGGLCYAQAVMSMDDAQDLFDLIIVNQNGMFIGTEYYDTSAVPAASKLRGFNLSELTVPNPVIGVPEDIDRNMMRIMLEDSDEIFRNVMTVDTSGTFLSGLQTYAMTDIMLSQLSTMTTLGVVTVGAASGCGSVNIATSAAATFFANAARWEARNTTTGGAIPITLVTVSSTGAGLVFDFDSTDPDYVNGATIAVRLKDASVLTAAGATAFYESIARNSSGGYGNELLMTIVA